MAHMHLLALSGSLHVGSFNTMARALQKLALEAVVVALDESISALPRFNVSDVLAAPYIRMSEQRD
jgi:NAD(P)H-dependent FMN reductase